MSSNVRHIKGIDLLRAFAVISILLYHLEIYWLFPGGFIGVDIFFTISGFLITYLLIHEIQKKNSISLKNFYIRRGKRLLPALFCLLIACLFISLFILVDTKSRTIKDVLPSIFYYSNWWQIFSDQSYFEQIGRPPLLQHLWSLAIEEQFYLIWPIFFLAIYRFGGQRTLALFSFLLATLSMLWMSWLSIKFEFPIKNDPSRIYLGTDTHSMGLLIGAFTAAVKDDLDRILTNSKIYLNIAPYLALLITVVLIFAMQFRLEILPELYRGGFFLISLLTGSLILLISIGSAPPIPHLPMFFLSYIGERAYSLYLWHWPIYILIGALIDIEFQIFFKVIITFVVAEFSYRYIENPIRFNEYVNWPLLKKSIYLLLIFTTVLLISTKFSYDDSKRGDELNEKKIKLPIIIKENVDRDIALVRENWNKQKCTRDLAKAQYISSGPQITVFGDSVMLGVQNHLSKSIIGVDVDAAVGRQGHEGISRVKEFKLNKKLAKIVLIHYGTNGFLNEKNVREILDELSDRDMVIIMNVYAQRKWQDENNILLRKLSNEYLNTKLLDWHEIVMSNQNILSSDQVHPAQKGIELISINVKNIANIPGDQDIDSKRRVIPNSCK